jgi:hypothetical protein
LALSANAWAAIVSGLDDDLNPTLDGGADEGRDATAGRFAGVFEAPRGVGVEARRFFLEDNGAFLAGGAMVGGRMEAIHNHPENRLPTKSEVASFDQVRSSS